MDKDSNIRKKNIFGALTWKMLERIITQGVGLVVQIIFARILLPEDFGNLAILIAVTNYAAIFVQSGIATAIIQKKDLKEVDIITVLYISLGIASLAYLVVFFLAPYIAYLYDADELLLTLRVISCVLFLNAINSVYIAIYTRQMDFKKLFIRTLIAVPVSGVIGIILAYAGFGLWALVLYQILNVLITTIILSFGEKIDLHIKPSLKSARQIYSFSGKILLANLVSGLGDTLRTMIIGKYYTKDELGYYDKANTYSMYVVQTVNSSISSVLLPIFSREQNDAQELKRMARRSIGVSSTIMFPILAVIAGVSKPLIVLLLTEKWSNCAPFLTLFCVMRASGCVTNIDRQVYYALGKSNITLYFEVMVIILHILNLFMNIKRGLVFITYGVIAVEWIFAIGIFFVSRKIFEYGLRERISDLLKPLVSSGVTFIAILIVGKLQLGNLYILLLQLIAGIAIYFLCEIFFKDNNFRYCLGVVKSIVTRKG